MPAKIPRQASISSPSYQTSDRIKALVEYGSQVEIDGTLAVKLYFRSGKEMLRMANMYCDENQLESAFILYYKFITLFLEKLPTHPDFKSAPVDQVLDYKRKVKKVFPLAEEIKKKLKERYIIEEKSYAAEQKRITEEKAVEEERRRQAIEEQERRDEELARKLQEEQETEFRNSQDEKYRTLKILEEEKLRDEQRRKDQGGAQAIVAGAAIAGATTAGVVDGIASNTVPSITPSSPSSQIPDSDLTGGDHLPPPPPSYSQYLEDISSSRPEIPDRQLKNKLVIEDSGSHPTSQPLMPSTASHVPSIDRNTKPSIDHHLSLGGFGMEMGGLRQVIVPSMLTVQFLAAALKNTLKEAETMGILCGVLTQGVFKITHLFIPKQTGGHDSCDMECEEELIFFQDELNLITLGWIHTHPTQTAFLSSVDLHSHFPWQKMMPEAVAIVCSPKFKETGIFKLTDRGLNVIGSCRETGFHPHTKDPPLFETCGHVAVTTNDEIQVVDKRINI